MSHRRARFPAPGRRYAAAGAFHPSGERAAGRWSRLAAVIATLIAGMVLAVPQPAHAATRYVLTAFTNGSESNMYVYSSPDAKNFSLLRANAYTPPSGLVRDPSVMRHTDGRYYIAYTTNWTGAEFGIASSTDLLNWTFVRNVPIPIAGITNTWAPEWFVDPADGSVNIIVSLTTTTYTNFRPYRLTAQNAALSAWSAPAALNGIQPNYIDTFVVRSGTTYHAFTKNETTKYTEHATAPSLGGPYTFVGTGNWSGWGSGLEGPAITQLPDGTFRLYADGYTSGRYFSADSRDLNTWSAKADLPGGLSGVVRHGTVLRETVPDASAFTSTAVAQHSGRCLDVPDGTTTAGARLRQWGCNGAAAQSFQFRPVGGAADQYTLVNTGNGLCVDVNSASTADGAAVIQWICGSAANQRFTLRPSQTAGVYSLVAVHSGKCIDVNSASTAEGAELIQWPCTGAANQLWRLAGRP
ncbi:hypothetical protein Sme01_58820 [Sphaerisporangium melleum]|uniref:Ricin B lectin domain-containing protein n=1 Tax=Sphaerisporangium melleum TaxID=321316 RepID=A0A917R7A5_9ACTN|nr:RICIN domain-containing protein [Sphaerisporangium melleum]GGK93463.1 hypothetical protein GCM10007964_39930 [Sphaerisporangium melleum]GII73406.1 hypothetical protein Sme01_58820 [Sphaerisporangium melleum]